jgi:hypothetical protein
MCEVLDGVVLFCRLLGFCGRRYEFLKFCALRCGVAAVPYVLDQKDGEIYLIDFVHYQSWWEESASSFPRQSLVRMGRRMLTDQHDINYVK